MNLHAPGGLDGLNLERAGVWGKSRMHRTKQSMRKYGAGRAHLARADSAMMGEAPRCTVVWGGCRCPRSPRHDAAPSARNGRGEVALARGPAVCLTFRTSGDARGGGGVCWMLKHVNRTRFSPTDQPGSARALRMRSRSVLCFAPTHAPSAPTDRYRAGQWMDAAAGWVC